MVFILICFFLLLLFFFFPLHLFLSRVPSEISNFAKTKKKHKINFTSSPMYNDYSVFLFFCSAVAGDISFVFFWFSNLTNIYYFFCLKTICFFFFFFFFFSASFNRNEHTVYRQKKKNHLEKKLKTSWFFVSFGFCYRRSNCHCLMVSMNDTGHSYDSKLYFFQQYTLFFFHVLDGQYLEEDSLS